MHFAFGYSLETDVHSQKLGLYYLSMESYDEQSVDENGVLKVDFSKRIDRGVSGIQYIPISISQYALYHYNTYIANNYLNSKKQFLNQANWLVKNQVVDGNDCGVWYFQYPFGKLIPPWISAMAQGEAISVLLRAYQETNEEDYLIAAKNAVKIFDVPLQNGGVVVVDNDDNIFFEEFPTDPAIHVLNGFIYALFGLYDFYRVTGSEHINNLFQKGIATITKRLADYDTGFWSKYSLNEKSTLSNHYNIASPMYHFLHVNMLLVLYRITGDQFFEDYHLKWKSYMSSSQAKLIELAYLTFRFSRRMTRLTSTVYNSIKR